MTQNPINQDDPAGPEVDADLTPEAAPAARDEAGTDAQVDEPAPTPGGPVGADPQSGGDEQDGGDGHESSADRLESEGDIAADYLEELLDIADMDGDIDTYVEGGRSHVSIVTEADRLVGKNGEVLEALQELARLVVMTETGHRSRLMLDIAGHRERRRLELTGVANEAIAEVRETKAPVRLAPMNPFERKIVHDIVAAADLASESEGVEPQRRVIILP